MRKAQYLTLALALALLLGFGLAARVALARCLDADDDCRVTAATRTLAPLWTETPAVVLVDDMSVDIAPTAALLEPGQPAATATPTWTPLPCPVDWSLPYSDANYQQLAWCRYLHYLDTGEILCPPPGTIWYDEYFQDAFCHPAPGNTPLAPPAPWWTPLPPWYHTPTPTP